MSLREHAARPLNVTEWLLFTVRSWREGGWRMSYGVMPLPPPAGFVLVTRRSPFLDLVGPLWVRDADGGHPAEYGFRVEDKHANTRGTAHGGILMTVADLVLGYGAAFSQDPPVALTTASMSVDFVGLAKVDDWVTGRADIVRAGRTLAFVNAYPSVDERRILRASSVFTVAAR